MVQKQQGDHAYMEKQPDLHTSTLYRDRRVGNAWEEEAIAAGTKIVNIGPLAVVVGTARATPRSAPRLSIGGGP